MNGINLISNERNKQINKHKYTPQVDSAYNEAGQLHHAAIMLLCDDIDTRLKGRPFGWNEERWVKMSNKSYKERLVISAAFLAAEIDRIDYSNDCG